MVDVLLRSYAERLTQPVGARLAHLGVGADLLTAVSMVAALASGVAVAWGQLGLGLAMLSVAGLLDVLDGAVARGGGKGSRRGAFFDSVADRVAEIFLFGGMAMHLVRAGSTLGGVVALVALAMGMLVSYIRARAQSLGMEARGGLVGRAERLVLLGAALVFAQYMLQILAAVLVLSAITAAQRFVEVWHQAAA